MMTKKGCLGWDIGGAHLKAVLLDEAGAVLDALQLPCPLWKGLNYLEAAIGEALKSFKIAPSGTPHAVTMTGELVDLFVNRCEGVVEIANSVTKQLGKETLFYVVQDNGRHGFVALEDVFANTARIASANWHASAGALAMHVSDALLIDIGSTTTDIIAIEAGKVVQNGLTDADRMQADSLVYTGVVRTPVMAFAQKLMFEGIETNVAAEYFATMADIYRLTGELLPEHDMAETADGKGKTALENARRLARMIGHDVESKPIESWETLASTCKALQMQQIKTAVLKQLKSNMTIIGAGAGGFLVKQIADELGREFKLARELISISLPEYVDVSLKYDIEVCFPAYAVATLAIKLKLRQHA
jgi:(4-(4-[2-(gamma-L-glutamylamino)ethyl]phenoxymethyl)furan-2-yl)methanamine synthase